MSVVNKTQFCHCIPKLKCFFFFFYTSACDDSSLNVISFATGSWIHQLKGHSGWVCYSIFSFLCSVVLFLLHPMLLSNIGRFTASDYLFVTFKLVLKNLSFVFLLGSWIFYVHCGWVNNMYTKYLLLSTRQRLKTTLCIYKPCLVVSSIYLFSIEQFFSQAILFLLYTVIFRS